MPQVNELSWTLYMIIFSVIFMILTFNLLSFFKFNFSKKSIFNIYHFNF